MKDNAANDIRWHSGRIVTILVRITFCDKHPAVVVINHLDNPVTHHLSTQ